MTSTSHGDDVGTGPGRERDRFRPGTGWSPPTWTRSLPLVPAVFLLAMFFAGPIIWSLYGSLTSLALTGPGARQPEFVGLDNYAQLIQDPAFPRALWLTFVFVIASAIIGQNVLGLAVAGMLRTASKPVAVLTRTVIVTVWVMPEIVGGFIMYAFFNPDGTLNQVLGAVGASGANWLFDFPLLAIVIANIWRGTAFSMMVYQAALSDVAPELREAAMIDGANARQRFLRVVLPVIRPTIATNLMLTTLQTLAVFTLIFVMTNGGPSGASTTLPVLAFQVAFRSGAIGYGTAVATVMLLVGAAFALLYVRALSPNKEPRS